MPLSSGSATGQCFQLIIDRDGSLQGYYFAYISYYEICYIIIRDIILLTDLSEVVKRLKYPKSIIRLVEFCFKALTEVIVKVVRHPIPPG